MGEFRVLGGSSGTNVGATVEMDITLRLAAL